MRIAGSADGVDEPGVPGRDLSCEGLESVVALEGPELSVFLGGVGRSDQALDMRALELLPLKNLLHFLLGFCQLPQSG